MKILTVIGARPQFIKAAVVSHQFKKSENIKEILVHTGQHYDSNMSDLFFQELEIPQPNYNLEIGSGNHGFQTGQMLAKIEELLLIEKPDWVLVYGDTNSTLAGALTAVKLHIPVAHVEAGLRSFNKKMPEEINRILTDHSSDLLFVPTVTGVNNLKNEGIIGDKVQLVGDVMYDGALLYGEKAQAKSDILNQLNLTTKNYILTTIHRAENTDSEARIKAIFNGLIKISQSIPVILPLHPRTAKMLKTYDLFAEVNRNLRLIEPVGYLDMVMLEKNAKLIVTDSGGVQKEAFFYQVPCVTLRDETEWIELVQLGWNRLVSPFDEKVVSEEIIKTFSIQNNLSNSFEIYGGGTASVKIVESLLRD